MSFKLINRVRMSLLSAAGSGPLALNLAGVGFQSFSSAGLVDGDTTPYVIEDGTPLGSVWEIGLGTYHNNGTFSRDTVTQSSLGGTSKITATANAILSATFRGTDLAGVGPLDQLTDVTITSPADGQLLQYNASTGQWENATLPTGKSAPALVQYQTVHQTTAGAVNVTLGSTPVKGNLLIALGMGGGGTVSSVYTPGYNFNSADVQFQPTGRYEIGYGIQSARNAGSSTFQIGSINSGGPGFAGVLLEVSGVDIARFSQWLVGMGGFSTSLSQVQALATVNALSVAFGGGDNVTVTGTNPSTFTVNSTDGTTRLIFNTVTAAGDWDGISATLGSSGNFGVIVMNLPGV